MRGLLRNGLVLSLLVLIPIAALAQGAPFMGNAACGGAGYGSCGPTPKAFVPGVEFSVGWVDHRAGVVRDVADEEEGLVQRAQWPLRGVLLGLSAGSRLGDRLVVRLSGSYLLSSNASGKVDLHGNTGGFPGWDFTPKDQWSVIEAAASYDLGVCGVVGGFRWDHFNTRLSGDPLAGAGDPFELDVKANAYLPFIGVSVSRYHITATFIGSPVVPGSLKTSSVNERAGGSETFNSSGDYSDGYFLEGSVEFNAKFRRIYGLGGFVKWTTLHAKVEDVDEEGGFQNVVFPSFAVSETLNKTAWIFGVNFNLDLPSIM